MKSEDIIKATRNSLNIYSFTAEALEKLIAAIQSEHKCQTCEALARTVMMDQTAHDTQPAAQRTWIGLTDEEIAEGIKQSWVTEQAFQSAAWWAESKLKEKNT
jgi:hypothetical protein